MKPAVSVVIPHYLGEVILECVEQLYARTDPKRLEVIVVDNQPRDDGSLAELVRRHPDVRLVKWEPAAGGNKGYGAGCNRGLEAARTPFALLLNNDVIVTEGWLDPLVEVMESDPTIAACQPKMLSVHESGRFDYGGAAGGLMDVFGYAFCLGRVFDRIETDTGQYDTGRDLFWTIGGAMFVRVSALKATGMLDEAFEMHMEEIDLCWRFHLTGQRIVSVPASVALHYGAMSLGAESFRKAYFNHRNNLVMVIKNWSGLTLLWALPARLAMELATVLMGPLTGNWRHPAAALAGIFWVLTHPRAILRRRLQTQARRRVADGPVLKKQYRGSLVAAFYLGRLTTASALLEEGPAPEETEGGGR